VSKKTIAFVADYFADEIPGGGEVNNDELIKLLSADYTVMKVKSRNLDPAAIQNELVDFYIISNFLELSYQSYTFLTERANYIIYEHDHKYVRNRNPAQYENFEVPESELVNQKFYQNAKAILCQSDFHANIVRKNLGLDTIKSLGGNLWSSDSLELMSSLAKQEKLDMCAIMQSDNWHKNTIGAVRYCKVKNLPHALIPPSDYHDFLSQLGTYKRLVFFPQTPETLSRIAVEARMMGMAVVTNQNVGATKEPWFHLKGEELIEVMRNKREEIPQIVRDIING
tara:strand:+ start:21863 stop:22711 length:849 start_codon:yes stop_codon:yes gene_type:complete